MQYFAIHRFARIDLDGSRSLDRDELIAEFERIGLTAQEAEEVMMMHKSETANGDEPSLVVRDFINTLIHVLDNELHLMQAQDVVSLANLFNLYDDDGNGKMDMGEFVKLATDLVRGNFIFSGPASLDALTIRQLDVLRKHKWKRREREELEDGEQPDNAKKAMNAKKKLFDAENKAPAEPIANESENDFGLKWEEVDIKACTGRELSNAKLSDALKLKLDFSNEEWLAFGITKLQSDDFIQSGDLYFKPAVEEEEEEEEEEVIMFRVTKEQKDTLVQTWEFLTSACEGPLADAKLLERCHALMNEEGELETSKIPGLFAEVKEKIKLQVDDNAKPVDPEGVAVSEVSVAAATLKRSWSCAAKSRHEGVAWNWLLDLERREDQLRNILLEHVLDIAFKLQREGLITAPALEWDGSLGPEEERVINRLGFLLNAYTVQVSFCCVVD